MILKCFVLGYSSSVAVLGLLGLTTTNTDVLFSNTMMYVQTYA